MHMSNTAHHNLDDNQVGTTTVDGIDIFGRESAYFNDPFYIIPIFIIIVTVTIICGNSLVLAVMLFGKSLSNTSGRFMASLACADLGIGVLVTPFSIYPSVINDWPYGQDLCIMASFFTELFSCISVSSLALIGVDRYLSIAKPLRYHALMTPEKARNIIIIKWIVGICLCSATPLKLVKTIYYADIMVCNVSWESELVYSYVMIGIVVVPAFSVITFTYYHIFRVAYKAARQTDIEEQRFHGAHSTTNRRKNAMKSFLVVLGFSVCWSPWLALQIQESSVFASNNGGEQEDGEHPHYPQAHFFSMWLAFSNSFLNFIIYSLSNRAFRADIRKVYRKVLRFCGSGYDADNDWQTSETAPTHNISVE
ncbi:putative G-protein coupled receptor 21 [Saccoglossus kowalevskii]|uniref:Probable G-protein coupled receptor 21-like n=1 Tax=Saccoglossus kowalevskii TaxID=10224 RepID=A0ABM0LWU4_SACKO|nr:PREDICTED: probable G-protein coupled receptor 21-like [Saccoglossus kowalevskii]